MPVLPPYQRGKESTGILAPDDPGMLGKCEEGQPITFTAAEEVLLLCFLTEGKEAQGDRILSYSGYYRQQVMLVQTT
jgi:hypothetical protein